MYLRRQCCPESTFIASANSDMASRYSHHDSTKSCVTWSDTVRSGAVHFPRPPAPRDRNNNLQQMVARQYIDYCNDSNGALPVSRPQTCCPHGSRTHQMSREPVGTISLRDVLTIDQIEDAHRVIPPVDEEVLIEAVHRATINECNSAGVPRMKPSANHYHVSRPPRYTIG